MSTPPQTRPPSTALMLAELRVATPRVRLHLAQIDAIGCALMEGSITSQVARIRLLDLGEPLLSDAQPGDTIGGRDDR